MAESNRHPADDTDLRETGCVPSKSGPAWQGWLHPYPLTSVNRPVLICRLSVMVTPAGPTSFDKFSAVFSSRPPLPKVV